MQTSLGIGLCTTLYRTICEPIVVVRKFEHDRVTFGVFDFRRQYTHRCGTVAPMLGVIHLGSRHDAFPCCRTAGIRRLRSRCR
jgi:hypothetical protein